MDEEMGEAIEGDGCLGFDLDLDYEYDAPKYFDLSGEEPVMEASSAEKWFETAESYPPSPLIMKIVCEGDILSQDVNHNPDADAQLNPPESNVLTKEEEHCKALEDVSKVALKPRVKNSTLMKPTASYLAKKTHRFEVKSLIRNKLDYFKSLESSGELKDCTMQATKRQRLERGHLKKATGTAHPDLIHKTRDKTDTEHANGNAGHVRMRLTVPREPILQTMRRAERFRARRGLINDNEPWEQCMQPRARLKMHPSNKNEFNLTNQSRAHGDSPGVASKAVHGCDRVSRMPEHRNSPNSRLNSANKMQECRSHIYLFKAGTSDKKETKLHTSRRQQKPSPLTEVFNKLSITTEAQHVSTSKSPLVPSDRGPKDSKENMRINHFRS